MPRSNKTFMDATTLSARLGFLRAYAPLAVEYPKADMPAGVEPALEPLLAAGEHGNTTDVTLIENGGDPRFSISIQGRNPRIFMPLDYVALDLATGFGLNLTIQRTAKEQSKRKDYPRISASGPNGSVFQVLRIIADAQPGHVVKQRADIGTALDHHYLGRDALVLTTEDEVRDAGKAIRYTTQDRGGLINAARTALEKNAHRLDLPASFDAEAYENLLRLAFGLADWRHGRVDSAKAGGLA